MSSLDRAFFHAYAKEQPAAVAEEPELPPAPEAVSPYVYFQSPRKPQLRYRLEPHHAPWGAAASHVDAAPLETPYEEGDYRLAGEEPPPATGWSSEGEARLAEPAATPVSAPAVDVAPSIVDIEARANRTPASKAAAPDPFADGIVCLPGMRVPESNYLAAFVPAEAVEEEAVAVATAPMTPVVEAAAVAASAPQAPRTEPAAIVGPAVAKQSQEPATADVVATPEETVADRSALLADETAAFWEVDRYLYPAVSDRLLSRYEYFSHAGEKLKQAAQAGLKVLGITGVGREEGRSTLAICLARAAARSGLKVALVDCDFQHPRLAQLVGLDVVSGWESVALGEVGLAEVAIRSLQDGILLLPLLDEAKTQSLSLKDERVTRIVAQARKTHDVVILDAGPLDAALTTGDSQPSQASMLDAAIVVWDRRRRKLDEAEAVARRLSSAGVEAVGIAENFAG